MQVEKDKTMIAWIWRCSQWPVAGYLDRFFKLIKLLKNVFKYHYPGVTINKTLYCHGELSYRLRKNYLF
jgi:hypothetical protein